MKRWDHRHNCLARVWFCDRLPAGRPGAPDDPDGAVVFLASESSRDVNGQTLLVDAATHGSKQGPRENGLIAGSTQLPERKNQSFCYYLPLSVEKCYRLRRPHQGDQLMTNPDRATEDFLNTFSPEELEEGKRLREAGQIVHVHGNHLTIEGKIRTESDEHNTRISLYGDNWKTEDNGGNDAAVVATMLERAELGDRLPEPPDPLGGKTIFELMEKELGRQLNIDEEQYLTKIDRRYRSFQTTNEIYDHDLVRIHPRWPMEGYEALNLWPNEPTDILDFWNHIAYALEKRQLDYPGYMVAITDTAKVASAMARWEREEEVGGWGRAVGDFNQRPPNPPRADVALRLLVTTDDARLQANRGSGFETVDTPAVFAALEEDYDSGGIGFDAPSEILWAAFNRHWSKEAKLEIDLTTASSATAINALFWQKLVEDKIVNLDEKSFGSPAGILSWQCTKGTDEDGGWTLQLLMADGSPISHSLRLLPGNNPLYLADECLFEGPQHWADDTDVQPQYTIPSEVLETSTGIGFLGRLGATLPKEISDRVRDRPMGVTLRLWLDQGHTTAASEHLWVAATATDEEKGRRERLGKDGWELVTEVEPEDGELPLYDRTALFAFPQTLLPLNPTFDADSKAFRCRVTKAFPERFVEWVEELPKGIEMDADAQVETLLSDPIKATVRFEIEEAEIDWFDLRLVVDVDGLNLSQTELRNLVAARGGFVRLKNNGWMRLQLDMGGAEKDAVERLGLDIYDLSGKTQRLHALQLADPGGKEAFNEEDWTRIQERAETLKLGVRPSPPEGLMAELRPYQQEGFNFLAYLSANNFGGLLADDMGLGKTVQSLTWMLWLRNEHEDEKPPPSLVVCPKSVLDVWAGEVEKFTPDLSVQVLHQREDLDITKIEKETNLLVINYAQLRSCLEELKSVHWLSIILDEGQQIKNPDSKAAKAARALKADNRLVLTGTPIENRLLDVWSLMAFAMPGVLGERSAFRDRFDRRSDPGAHHRLSARLRPFLLRRTKNQVAMDLPARMEEELPCEMEPEQAAVYKGELDRIRQMVMGMAGDTKALNKNRFAVLQGLTRLRQICCHPTLLKDGSGGEAPSAKMDALFYLLDQLREEGHKALVFSQFTTMLDLIKDRLEEESRPYHLLTGKTENRAEVVKDFQRTDDASVFLLSLKAGGTGLNLTAASYVVLYDPWWNPAVERQAIDRTHRIGQTNKVIAYRLITRNTVEEKIRLLQRQKEDLFTGVLGEDAFSKNLQLSDLNFLLGEG